MSPSSPDSSPRVLVVLRHGKAEPYAADDHGRRLVARGEREATDAGAWLGEQDVHPTHALVSSAVRARMTWERAAEALGSDVEPDVSDAAYAASVDSLLELVRLTPAEAGVLVVVGHNPTLTDLVLQLDDGEPDVEAFRAVAAGLPTAGVAVFEVSVPWSDLDQGAGRLVASHTGRD